MVPETVMKSQIYFCSLSWESQLKYMPILTIKCRADGEIYPTSYWIVPATIKRNTRDWSTLLPMRFAYLILLDVSLSFVQSSPFQMLTLGSQLNFLSNYARCVVTTNEISDDITFNTVRLVPRKL